MEKEDQRLAGDEILHDMSQIESNFGTETPLDAVTNANRKAKLQACWNRLKRVDSVRAELVKPQILN